MSRENQESQFFKAEKVDPRIDSIYKSAIAQHEAFKSISEREIKEVISQALREIDIFEETGERDKKRLNIPEEIANRIGLIWTFSGPGTYDSLVKDDAYKNYEWARGMDRERLNYTARLARRITASVSGQRDFDEGSLADIRVRKQEIKKMILEYGPYIVYNGTHLENTVVADVLTREGVIIPKERVKIIDEDIRGTVDQIKTFKTPTGFDTAKEIAIISHAPQLARIIRMINRYKPFPEGTVIRLFPLPTPAEGKSEYARMEIQGILYCLHLSKDRDADREPYPYLLNPGESAKEQMDDGKQ